jgi:hypothetical protein
LKAMILPSFNSAVVDAGQKLNGASANALVVVTAAYPAGLKGRTSGPVKKKTPNRHTRLDARSLLPLRVRRKGKDRREQTTSSARWGELPMKTMWLADQLDHVRCLGSISSAGTIEMASQTRGKSCTTRRGSRPGGQALPFFGETGLCFLRCSHEHELKLMASLSQQVDSNLFSVGKIQKSQPGWAMARSHNKHR